MDAIKSRLFPALTGAFLFLASIPLQAVTLDLTEVSSGTINNAIYSKSDYAGNTTGVFNEFVAIQRNDIEAGYNSSGTQVLNAIGGYNIQISDLFVRNIGGTDYYEFVLNIREPEDQPVVILDQLRIFVSPTGSQTTTDVTDPSPLGVMVYDQGFGNEVYVGQTSTDTPADMFFYVPTSNFAGSSSSDYVYLYSRFYAGGGGPESWGLVPEADTWVAASLCLLIPLGAWIRKRFPRQPEPVQ